MSWFSKKSNSLILSVYVVPRSSRTEIVGLYNGCLKIKLKAPPVDNAANEELINFLSDKLNVRRSNIEITHGLNQKRKILSVCGIDSKTVETCHGMSLC